VSPSVPDWVRAPVRRLVTAALAGLLVGAVGVIAFAVDDSLRTATEQVFSLGALAFGVGLLGWSGSVMAGRGIENMQRHLDSGSNWTEADSRRAMTRIVGFGFGVMLVASLATVGL
jgi:sulfite exporter TauE/SafE